MSSGKLIISNHGGVEKSYKHLALDIFLTITGLLIVLMIEPSTITLKGIFAFMHCSNSMIFVIEKILLCIAVLFGGVYISRLGKENQKLIYFNQRKNFHIS